MILPRVQQGLRRHFVVCWCAHLSENRIEMERFHRLGLGTPPWKKHTRSFRSVINNQTALCEHVSRRTVPCVPEDTCCFANMYVVPAGSRFCATTSMYTFRTTSARGFRGTTCAKPTSRYGQTGVRCGFRLFHSQSRAWKLLHATSPLFCIVYF